MADKKKAAAKKAAERDEEKDFAQAQPPRHERDEVDETVAGVDGEVVVSSSPGAVSVAGDGVFDADALHTLVQVLERARLAV